MGNQLVHTYRKLKPGIVAIGLPANGLPSVTKTPPYVIAGTGFCVDPRGTIVSCRHVFEGLQELVPDFGETLEKLIRDPGHVEQMDLIVPYALFFVENQSTVGVVPVRLTDAVVKMDIDFAVMRAGARFFLPPAQPYPTVGIGDSNTLKEGQDIAASGFPFGAKMHEEMGSVNASLSVGVVSAILPSPAVIEAAPENFTRFQVDMTLNRGNSGGPVFRPGDGEVMGIVERGMQSSGSPVGINYAIPINQAKQILDEFEAEVGALRRRAGYEEEAQREPEF